MGVDYQLLSNGIATSIQMPNRMAPDLSSSMAGAVLIGLVTASSGETTAIGLHEADLPVQSFGQTTGRYANSGYWLRLIDGAMSGLSEPSTIAVSGKRFPNGVWPDIEVTSWDAMIVAEERIRETVRCQIPHLHGAERGFSMPVEQALRIVTWNIEEGGGGRLDAIHGVLSRSRADVIALQEVTSQANLVDIANRLEMEYVFGEAQNGYHLAWLSRQPIRRCLNHQTATLAKTLLEIEVDWAGKPVSLFATHLASRHDPQSPLDEIGLIVREMEIAGGNPHLLVGDFNSLAPGDPVGTPPDDVEPRGDALPGAPRRVIDRLLRSGYIDCFRHLHPSCPGFTYPSSTPWLRLDYMFASPQLANQLHHCQIIPSSETLGASDHLPLLAILQKAETI